MSIYAEVNVLKLLQQVMEKMDPQNSKNVRTSSKLSVE